MGENQCTQSEVFSHDLAVESNKCPEEEEGRAKREATSTASGQVILSRNFLKPCFPDFVAPKENIVTREENPTFPTSFSPWTFAILTLKRGEKYNEEGELICTAYYNEGVKEGMWLFWTENRQSLIEVNYLNNKVLDYREFNLDEPVVKE